MLSFAYVNKRYKGGVRLQRGGGGAEGLAPSRSWTLQAGTGGQLKSPHSTVPATSSVPANLTAHQGGSES